MTLLAVYRQPFDLQPQVRRLATGATVADVVAGFAALPPDFCSRGTVCLAGTPVPRGLWHAVRPKAMLPNGVPVEITLHYPPMGGGDDGKNILGLIASIALTVATGFIAAGGAQALLGSSFAGGTIGATALAAGVSLVGSLALSALIAPPTQGAGGRDPRIVNPGAASAQGNVLEPNTAVPRVIGERKIFPPLLAEPLTYFDGPDEVVEAVFGLAGPHEIRDVRAGAAPLTDQTDVEFEVREGRPGTPRLQLVTRQARTEALQAELRGHSVAESDGRTLESTTGNLLDALPQVQIVATRSAPDEHWLHLIFPGGLHKQASETDRIRVPIRIRMRRIGDDDWRNLPELHFQGANLRQMRATIKLIWSDDASTSPAAAATEGWVEARRAAPGQTVAPVQAAFAADPYFSTGSGDNWLAAGNTGTTGVDHVILDRWTAAFYLDVADWEPGRWEIEIRRGAAILNANWSASAYTVSGVVWDLFGYQGDPGQIAQTRDGVQDQLYLLRSVSVWNEHPVPTDDLALVALRARNRALDAISVIAGGLVPDWDGTGWRTLVVTDNPAPHLRDVWCGAQTPDPLPPALVDDAGLVAWRTACATAGHRCNAIMEGQSVDEAATLIASAGFARPLRAELWGVARDYDRSAEAPVQLFTPRNSRGFSWRKAFPRLPDGLRVSFADEADDWQTRQIEVPRPDGGTGSGFFEQVSYDSLVTEAEARARALYDQNQAIRRAVFYSLDAPAEALVCRRGDLVGVQHDLIAAEAGAARIIDLTLDSSGDITAIRLDSEVTVEAAPELLSVTDLLAVPDMLALGKRTGVAIRRSNGSPTVHAVDNAAGTTDLLTFDPPLDKSGVAEGDLVTFGRLGSEYLRLIVLDVTPRQNFEASLTLVDEAPEIFA